MPIGANGLQQQQQQQEGVRQNVTLHAVKAMFAAAVKKNKALILRYLHTLR
jgi:hypothetical protein